MRFRNYKLDLKPQKLLEDLNLLKTDKCLVKATRNTVALPILINENTEGHVLHGSGQFIMDTIIETEKGAIGKPTIKDLDKPFFMIGKTPEIKNALTPADGSDLTNLGYSSAEAFVKAADEFCTRLFQKQLRCTDINTEDSCLFAFANNDDFDVLIARQDDLVYASKEKVFVLKKGRAVLTSPKEVVVAKRGKSVVIARNRVLDEE